MKFFVVCFWIVAALLSTNANAAAQMLHGEPPGSADAEARITAEKVIDDRTRDLTVSSPAMGMSIPVRVILPKGWSKKSKTPFPVLYMLHGGHDAYTSWTRETDVEEYVQRTPTCSSSCPRPEGPVTTVTGSQVRPAGKPFTPSNSCDSWKRNSAYRTLKSDHGTFHGRLRRTQLRGAPPRNVPVCGGNEFLRGSQ